MKSRANMRGLRSSAEPVEQTVGADFRDPRRPFGTLRVLCAVAALASAAAAPPPGPAVKQGSGDVSNLALSIQRATLDNGLRVVLNVDKSSPNVAVCVFYDVGSRNEVPGRTGFAHLFEHMMFEGSKHVGKGEHFKLVTARGGTLNGTTSGD